MQPWRGGGNFKAITHESFLVSERFWDQFFTNFPSGEKWICPTAYYQAKQFSEGVCVWCSLGHKTQAKLSSTISVKKQWEACFPCLKQDSKYWGNTGV